MLVPHWLLTQGDSRDPAGLRRDVGALEGANRVWKCAVLRHGIPLRQGELFMEPVLGWLRGGVKLALQRGDYWVFGAFTPTDFQQVARSYAGGISSA